MKRLQQQILPFLPVVIAPFILLSPVLLSGKAIFWGTPSLQFIPWRTYAWELIQSGHLPLWNPLLGMGTPLMANYQSALIYPPNWIDFLLYTIGGIGFSAWSQALLVAVHLAWAGTGMIFLTRKLGLGILAQTVAGLSFGLSGYIVSRSGFLSINAAVAWLPWVIFATHNLLVHEINNSCVDKSNNGLIATTKNLQKIRKRVFVKRYLFLILVVTAQLLSGHAQTAWYTLLLAGLWSGYLGWVKVHHRLRIEEGSFKVLRLSRVFYIFLIEILRNWISIAFAFIFALALAAIQLIPTAEYLYNSQRAAAVGYEFAMTYSFWPWHILTLIAPELFGSPVIGDYWGYGYYWEDAIYIGLLPLILAIFEIVHLNRRSRHSQSSVVNVSLVERPNFRKSFVIFLLLILTLSSIMALGKNTPIFPWLYYNVPSFSLFQAPTRFTIWGVLALVILAALGIDEWFSLGKRGGYWVRLGSAGFLAASIGAGLSLLLIEGINTTFIRATAMFGINGFVIGVLALTNPRLVVDADEDVHDRKLWNWEWAVILTVGINLLIYGWGLLPGIDLEFFTTTPSTALEIIHNQEANRLFLPYEDEYSLKFDRFKRTDTFHPGEDWSNLREVMLPNLTMVDRIPSANNFDPLVPNRYAVWMEILQDIKFEENNVGYLKLLNHMGVSMVETIDSSIDEIGVRFSPVKGSGRIRLVPCAVSVDKEQDALSRVIQADIDIEKTVILEGVEQVLGIECDGFSSINPRSTISISEESPNRLDLNVESNFSGWLVISDVWYPGWHAYVDGISTPIYHANYLFRSIYVDRGQHNIAFVYRPRSFRFGLGISIVAWLVLVGWWILSGKHETSKP